jgi:ribokinase
VIATPQRLPPLQLAVVGHLEWVNFLAVNALPQAGVISRAHRSLEEPAGAGAVVAVQLARLSRRPVLFFTALGRDAHGERSEARLRELGVEPVVAWREQPTRRGISLVDGSGDRAITVIGERLTPLASDPLDWERLEDCDGVFVSASDAAGLRLARQARVLTATPRLRLPLLQDARVKLDALIGSGLDADEQIPLDALDPAPALTIATEGAAGGTLTPGGRYSPEPLPGPLVESYGCGDSFAAGITAGLAAGWTVDAAVTLGARCGAACASRFGPYG